MYKLTKSVLRFGHSKPASHASPHKGPGQEAADDEDELELPVNPDQGAPLIPDDDGAVKAPS